MTKLNKYYTKHIHALLHQYIILMTYNVLLSAVQDSCASSPCHYGTCRHTTSHSRYECICESGWTGQYCAQKKSKIYNLLLPRILLTRIKSSLLRTQSMFLLRRKNNITQLCILSEACIFRTKGQTILYAFRKVFF